MRWLKIVTCHRKLTFAAQQKPKIAVQLKGIENFWRFSCSCAWEIVVKVISWIWSAIHGQIHFAHSDVMYCEMIGYIDYGNPYYSHLQCFHYYYIIIDFMENCIYRCYNISHVMWFHRYTNLIRILWIPLKYIHRKWSIDRKTMNINHKTNWIVKCARFHCHFEELKCFTCTSYIHNSEYWHAIICW